MGTEHNNILYSIMCHVLLSISFYYGISNHSNIFIKKYNMFHVDFKNAIHVLES